MAALFKEQNAKQSAVFTQYYRLVQTLKLGFQSEIPSSLLVQMKNCRSDQSPWSWCSQCANVVALSGKHATWKAK